jgi:hypothetical protein
MSQKSKTPAKIKRNWVFSRVSRNVHTFDIDLKNQNHEFKALLLSDCHWDNPKSDQAQLKKLLTEALEIDAPVLDIGDFFCAMQGRWDKRSSKSDLRPEHQHSNYLDCLVSTALDWLKPYSEILCLRGEGNHESSIKKRQETDLTERLTQMLKSVGSPAQTGGFSGYVRFKVTSYSTTRKSIKYWYHHGHGGGGPVTKGVIQTARRAAFISDANIIHTGHVHEQWVVNNPQIRLSDANKIEPFRQVHVCTPGFKEEFGDGFGGWHIERGAPPKPTGGAWLRIYLENKQPTFEITEAR